MAYTTLTDEEIESLLDDNIVANGDGSINSRHFRNAVLTLRDRASPGGAVAGMTYAANGSAQTASLAHKTAAALVYVPEDWPYRYTFTRAAGSNIILFAGGIAVPWSVTSSRTINKMEAGAVYDNAGAGAEVEHTLPSDARIGHVAEFVVIAAQNLRVTAPASTTITIGASTSGAAGNIVSATALSSVTLRKVSSTQWVAIGGNNLAAWTVT